MRSSLSLFALLALLAGATARPTGCFSFKTRKLVYLHIMKTGGLSVDALLRCRCASSETPCAILREDGSAKHSTNLTGDLITRFKDSMLYGSIACAGGPACTAAGVGSVPMEMTGTEQSHT